MGNKDTEQTTNNIVKTSSIRSYKDLIVYKKAKEITLEIARYYSEIKLTWTDKYLIDQLIRSAALIGANLAEGYGRLYKLDYRRFVSISRGSSFEVDYWASLIQEIRKEDQKMLNGVTQTNVEISKMLTGLMKSLKN